MLVERRLSIPAVLNRVREACDFVAQAAESTGLDENAVYYCQMAVDEWCTNVIEHGYQEESDLHRINLLCECKPEHLTVIISDNSPAFDPTRLEPNAPAVALEQREPGGLGWYFIKKIMDEVHYEHREGQNHLTMIRHGKHAGTTSPSEEDLYPTQALGEKVWVLLLSGRLDATGGPKLEKTLMHQIEAGHLHLILDLSAVSYISSGGLKVLVATWKKLHKAGGHMVLCGVPPRVRKVLEISGFDTVFTIASSVGDAALKLDATLTGS